MSEALNQVRNICADSLAQRIRQMKLSIKSAEDRLKDMDYMQCAIRLEIAANQAQFDELTKNIFDAASRK